MDTSALRASLKQALLEYRERRPNLSLRAIARNSGVNRYFLNKLLEEKTGDNSPLDINQVLLFLKFITKKNTIKDIMESSSREVQDLLSSIYHDTRNDRVLKESSHHLNLYDYHTYFILHFAAFNKNGIRRDKIDKILGASAVKSLRSLLEKNIVKEEDGRIIIVGDQNFTYSPELMKHHFGNYSRFFDPDHMGQKRNFISVLSQGVNRNTLQEVQALYIEAFKKVDSLLRDPENWGEIPIFAISCVDSFVDEIEDG